MSSTRAKAVSEINLEEFERRLRAAGSLQTQVEDPLAELTRLVDTIASERAMQNKVVDFSATRLPKADRFTPPAAPLPAEPNSEDMPTVAREAEVEGLPVIPTPQSIELRPGIEESEPDRQEVPTDLYFDEHETRSDPLAHAPPRRAGSWYFKVGGLTALAVVMVAGAAAMKLGVPGLPKSPPLILAAAGPSKVAPPSEAAVQSPNDSGALLTKDSATTAPVKLVTNEEQPVDLKARAAVTASVATPTSPVAPSSSLAAPGPSPVAPTIDTPVVPPSDANTPMASQLSSTPKRVKTVSVRPDGTLIAIDTAPADAPPGAAAPDPAPLVRKLDLPAPAPLAGTPTIELPSRPPVKSSARVNIAKTDTTVPADASPAPLQLGPVTSHPDKPPKIPTKLRPPAAADTETPAAPVVADADPARAPAASGGDWAVQVAAPRSEAEARASITKLTAKYADALGGASLAVHKAERNGETIYRIRASGMSKSEAGALCARLKAAGGDCFPAKN